MSQPNEYILTLSCPDTRGIVAAVSTFLTERGGDIEQSAQFGDAQTRLFFMRVVFAVESPDVMTGFHQQFEPIGARFAMDWQLRAVASKPRVLLMVSKFGHCLNDLLFRLDTGQLPMDVPAIVSNHTDFQPLAHG